MASSTVSQPSKFLNHWKVLSPESLHQNKFDDSGLERHALAAFLEDYCAFSKPGGISRGYLEGLKPMLAHALPSSDIAKAVKMLAFASFGNKIGDQHLVHLAKNMYPDTLHSFQGTMSNMATSNTTESLTTAVLLGLYEVCLEVTWVSTFFLLGVTSSQIISADESHPGEHCAHFRGVAGILTSQNSPFSRDPAEAAFRAADTPSITSPPVGPLMVSLSHPPFSPLPAPSTPPSSEPNS